MLSEPDLSQLQPGQIDPAPASVPDAPSDLTGPERILIAHMVKGMSWREALDAEGVSEGARIRRNAPRDAIKAECERLLQDFADECAGSRRWIIRETMLLYKRAVSAEPVLDRKGNPTGAYRFDGATARQCLEMLGIQQGMFKAKGQGFAPSDVADLLAAVAARGRPPLPGDRARLVGSSSTAAAQPEPDKV